MVSVLVVNDQALRRLALRLLLDAEPDLTVVGDTASRSEAIRIATALRPDVVVMDSDLSQADDTETVRRLAHLSPPPLTRDPSAARTPRVLVLIPADQEGDAHSALRAGAGGFLLDDAAPGELAATIRIVAAGYSVITPGLTRALMDVVGRERPDSLRLNGAFGLDALTTREREILIGVASGWTNTEIAERLSIAPATVKTHVSNILTKTGARARAQAVTFAYESGLVRPAA